MKNIYYIRDTDSQEWYFEFSGSIGFCADWNDAKQYSSKEEAEAELSSEDTYYSNVFDGRIVEIKEYYSFKQR